MAAAIPSSGIHWLEDLKLDISTHSRAWRQLRNKAFVKASLLVDNVNDLSVLPELRKQDLVEGIEQDLKNADFYFVAQADAFNRTAAFLQHSARRKGMSGFLDQRKTHREQVDAALCVLLSSRKDLVKEFTKCMNSELSPSLRKLLLTRILRDEALHADIVSALCSEKMSLIRQSANIKSFQMAQSFLSANPFFAPVALHFQCIKTMEVVILYGLYLSTADRVSSPDIQKQIEVFFEQKEMQILCHLAVPLIHAFAFVASPPQKGDNANLHAKNLAENESNDVILLEMAMAFIRRMPPSLSGEQLSPTSELNIERYLSVWDPMLLAHLQSSFSEDRQGLSRFVCSLRQNAFVGRISLDVSSFLLDQMVIGSSELMTDARLPSIETWSEWICTVILSSLSAELLSCQTVSQLNAKLLHICLPQLTVDRIIREFEMRLGDSIQSVRTLNSTTGQRSGLAVNPAPLWMLNEDVVPFSEQMIINKENASAHRLAEEWIQNRRSAIRQKGIHKLRRIVKQIIIWHRYFKSVRNKQRLRRQESLLEKKTREDIEKLEQEKTRAASEHVQQMDRDHKRADSLPHSIGEEDRTTKNNAYTADTTWKVEESVDHTVEVDNELEGSLNHSTHSSALVKDGCPPGLELEYLNTFGHIILNAVVGVESLFGGSSGRGHALNATLKLQSVLEQRLKRIQMGLFRRELSRTDIAALSPAEKLAYFSAVDNLMEENASERKKLSKEIKKKPLGVLEQEASLESILGVAVSLVDEVFTGSPKVKKDRIKACISAEQVWKKWEADVQIKTWGETLSDEELKTWLKPDQNLPSNSKSVGQEKERRRLRDTYFQGMQDKKAKWI